MDSPLFAPQKEGLTESVLLLGAAILLGFFLSATALMQDFSRAARTANDVKATVSARP
jgi:hypothetical protein